MRWWRSSQGNSNLVPFFHEISFSSHQLEISFACGKTCGTSLRKSNKLFKGVTVSSIIVIKAPPSLPRQKAMIMKIHKDIENMLNIRSQRIDFRRAITIPKQNGKWRGSKGTCGRTSCILCSALTEHNGRQTRRGVQGKHKRKKSVELFPQESPRRLRNKLFEFVWLNNESNVLFRVVILPWNMLHSICTSR